MARPHQLELDRDCHPWGVERIWGRPDFCYLSPNSSARSWTKFLARPAETITPTDSASLISAEVAPASFAPAKALRSQVGQPAATAHPAWISLRVFASSTSSYSKSICIFFRVVIFSPFPRLSRSAGKSPSSLVLSTICSLTIQMRGARLLLPRVLLDLGISRHGFGGAGTAEEW